MDKVTTSRRSLDRLLADYEHAARTVKEERTALRAVEQSVKDSAAAQKIIQDAAQAVQTEAHARLASVVGRCLHAVFGEDAYDFRIIFDRKRGRTEARLVFIRDGQEIDPDALGGGVIDVASMALRIACLLASVPRRRRLLVLDEPWRHLSRKYRPAVRGLVESLAIELGIQFLIVTHSRELVCGKVIEVGR